MFKVGLTGGIGCGKSTASRLFRDFDIPVIDADDIAHELVSPGQPALIEITLAFGESMLNPDGSLNRSKLRNLVFSDSQAKAKLEAIMHPLVYAAMQNHIETLTAPYCIVSIPLLFETGRIHYVDRILVVDCPLETQIERVKQRDNLDESTIQAIISSQVSREYRLAHADDIIDNTATSADLAENVKKLHNFYLTHCASSGHTR